MAQGHALRGDADCTGGPFPENHKGASMAFENTKAEIDTLLAALQDAPHDRFELYLTIMQKLNELKAYGMPLPADLVELESRLEREIDAEQRVTATVGRRQDRPDRAPPRRHKR
jgi:hypothetical protein